MKKLWDKNVLNFQRDSMGTAIVPNCVMMESGQHAD